MSGGRVVLLGHPVSHSLSPAMHNAAFAALDLPHHYDVLDVTVQDLPNAFALLRTPELVGANVTVPHKESARALVDDVEPVARATGAVNTVFRRGGRLVGDNTDVHGFIAATHDERGRSVLGTRVLVLGAGGAARACVHALLPHADVFVANRTPERAAALVRDLEVDGARATAVPYPTSDAALAELRVDAVVNATTLGLHGEDPLDGVSLPRAVVDLIPVATETPLVGRARRSPDTIVVDGLAMLLHQAAASFERWTGVPAPLDVMRRALPRRA